MRGRAGLLGVLWVALVAMVGANASAAADQTALASGQPTPSAEYRIAAGDELDIVVPLNPEFNVRTFVRPDGKISLELIDEIAAEGLTTAELTDHLRNAYSTELRDPDISVNVVSMAARIYVDGHVARPGEYPWSRQVTAMQAVSLAGGLRETANGESILVVRLSPGGEQRVFQIDLEELAKGEGLSRDLFLAPYDTVYAPSTRVADLNKWMDQYIRENIPFSPRRMIPGAAVE